MTAPQAHPLQWPAGQPRTSWRERARFKTSFAVARDTLAYEIDRLGANYPVLSSNVEIRLDGQPYANRAEPYDPGVAIYFEWKGTQMCFACDKWDLVKDNIQAIRKTIEAIRGIERWGSTDMMERAFRAFEELPAPGQTQHWRDVLGLAFDATLADAERRFKELALTTHPDRGGDEVQFLAINEARNEARKILRP